MKICVNVKGSWIALSCCHMLSCRWMRAGTFAVDMSSLYPKKSGNFITFANTWTISSSEPEYRCRPAMPKAA